MDKLPILISVPHAGLSVPHTLKLHCRLNASEIAEDGDEGAAAIYHGLKERVAAFITTDIARAIVDLNRAEADRRKDGIVKTHTCWDVEVYREFPPEDLIEAILAEHYRPYHRKLTEFAASPDISLGVDCHTMAAVAPPVAPDRGERRPWVCLSDLDGASLPPGWMESLKECFEAAFGSGNVSINDPFHGGHIVRAHHSEMPWVQVELSREPFMTDGEKQARVLQALTGFWRRTLKSGPAEKSCNPLLWFRNLVCAMLGPKCGQKKK